MLDFALRHRASRPDFDSQCIDLGAQPTIEKAKFQQFWGSATVAGEEKYGKGGLSFVVFREAMFFTW